MLTGSVVARAIALCLGAILTSCAAGSPGRTPPRFESRPNATLVAGIVDDLLDQLGPDVERMAVVGVRGARPADEALASHLTEMLITELGSRGLELVERRAVRAALEEQALGQSGAVDPTSAAEAGRIAGASILLTGSVTPLTDTVDVHLRAVDAETARILATAGGSLPSTALAEHLPPEPAKAPPLILSTLFVAERAVGDRYEKVLVRDGSRLLSGDGLKIAFETNRDAHVYVLLLDSKGKASVVFPSDAIAASNRAVAGKKFELPPGRDWFYLDDAVGRETIYVLASLAPLEDPAALSARLEASSNAAEADQIIGKFVAIAGEPTPVTRGLGGIRPGRTEPVELSNGERVEQALELLEGTGAVVRAVTFIHE